MALADDLRGEGCGGLLRVRAEGGLLTEAARAGRGARGAATVRLLLASFGAYSCMYAFRKPVAATEFVGASFLGTAVDLKTALMVGQVVGYAASKYLGIVVCSALGRRSRGAVLVAFVLFAEVSLAAFAVTPDGLRVVALFFSALPLGMVWGLVVRYLEGRRSSEVLLAGLSVSFIVSSGAVKDVGVWLVTHRGISEAWMPAATGALFLLPFVACVAILEGAPEPDPADRAARVARAPMGAGDRRGFVRRYGVGLAPLLAVYFFLTAYRDFRDNYGIEIFRELGYLGTPALFSRSEIPAGISVLVALALLGLVKSNRRGLQACYALMVGGLAVVLGGTVLFRGGRLDGLGWMIVVGVGSYLAYVPVGAVLFERLTAAGGSVGTAVFGIYLADAVGYTGSVGVQLLRDLGAPDLSRAAFFEGFSVGLAAGGGALLIVSALAVMTALPVPGDRERDGVAGADALSASGA